MSLTILNCNILLTFSLNAEIRKYIEDPISNENSLRINNDKSNISNEFSNMNIWDNNTKKNHDDSIKFEKNLQKLIEIKEEKKNRKSKTSKTLINTSSIRNSNIRHKLQLSYLDDDDDDLDINEVDECSVPDERVNTIKRSEISNKNDLNTLNKIKNSLTMPKSMTIADDFFDANEGCCQQNNYINNGYNNIINHPNMQNVPMQGNIPNGLMQGNMPNAFNGQNPIPMNMMKNCYGLDEYIYL